jgi:uncharacterized membrane protein YkoI
VSRVLRFVGLGAVLLAGQHYAAGAAAGTPAAAAGAAPAATPQTLSAAPMTMDEAVKMAEQRFHARVVKAETQKEGDGHVVYVLRLLNEAGHVWTVRVDATSGAVL